MSASSTTTTRKKRGAKPGKGKGKGKGKALVSMISFVGAASLKDLKKLFGVCEVACLDKRKRLWLVPVKREGERGVSVLRTAYIGDPAPKEIGFAPSAEIARDYLSQNVGIPTTAWKKCPVFSMLNPMRELV